MIVVERTCQKCKATYRSDQEHTCSKPRVVTSRTKRITTRADITTPGERTKAWRIANRDRYNEYMRKRRAKAKEAGE